MTDMTPVQFMQACIDAYANLLSYAAPILFLFCACNISINIIVSAFMGKKIHFGGD